jgi:hypothetical protein
MAPVVEGEEGGTEEKEVGEMMMRIALVCGEKTPEAEVEEVAGDVKACLERYGTQLGTEEEWQRAVEGSAKVCRARKY